MNRDTAMPLVKGRLPGENARAWIEYYSRFAAKTTQAYPFVWDIRKPARGPFCTDPDANRFLDFVGHVGAAPLGYNNPEILDYLFGLNFVDPLKYAGQDFWVATADRPSDEAFATPAKLMEKIIESTAHLGLGDADLFVSGMKAGQPVHIPEAMSIDTGFLANSGAEVINTIFLINSGAEAVENAMKICYAKRGKGKAICFKGAFHGRTHGALTLNASKKVQKEGFHELPVHVVKYCDCAVGGPGLCRHGFWAYDNQAGEEMSELEQMLGKTGYVNPEEVAFIIVEPLQGEGGYIVPNRQFMAELARVSKEYNIPLISDEVQAGIGRTGKMWAIEHYGITPDVITAAKGLRVGATISRKDMFPSKQGRISSTWGGGDILHSAIGYKTLEIIMRDRLYDNAALMGEYFMQNLRALKNRHRAIREVRGRGLMVAVDFWSQEYRNKMEEECFQRGFLTLSCGYKALRFLPPLDVTKRELDIALNVTEDVLKVI